MPATLAKLIVAQSKHETANYTHRFFTTYNNAFGYAYVPGPDKWQLSTPGTNADNGQPIAQYASVANSVHELTDWIKRRVNEGKFPQNLSTINSGDQYAALLKGAGYYAGSQATYASRLNEWFATLGNLAENSAPYLLLAVLGFLAYRYRRQLGLSKK